MTQNWMTTIPSFVLGYRQTILDLSDFLREKLEKRKKLINNLILYQKVVSKPTIPTIERT